jgi:hypothetical protein
MFGKFAGWLGNLLTGGLLDKGLAYLAERDRAKLAAMNDAEKRKAEERADIRQTAKEIRLATAGHWEMRLITFVIAACFASHLVLITLDTLVGYPWNVPKFPAPFDEWEGLILLSFFGVQVADRVTSKIVGASVVKEKVKERLTRGRLLG